MKKEVLKFFLTIALFIVGILSISNTNMNIHASAVNGIALQPNYSKTQISKNGILNPKVKPGEKIDLSFNIINLSYQSTKISISPNTAVTSSAPSIDYSKSNYKYDDSLKYNFRDFFNKKKLTMRLQPKKITRVTFTATIPKSRFNGILVGGFYISTDQESTTNLNGTTLNNKYSYVMPAILKEDSKTAIPKLTLGDVNAQNTLNGPVVTSNIYNKRSAMISNMKITTDITDSNKNNIFHLYRNNTSVAPNSNFAQESYITKDNLNPGNYHIKIVADSPQGKWILEKDFTVSVSQYLSTVFQNNSLFWLIVLVVILLLLIIIGYFIYRRIKNNRKIDKSNNSTRISSGSHFK